MTVARAAFRAIRIVAVVLFAIPGLVFGIGRVVELYSPHPFSSYRADDLWTTVHLTNIYLLMFTSPVMIPLMWWSFSSVRVSLSPAAKGVLTAIVIASTLSVAFFWVWAVR